MPILGLLYLHKNLKIQKLTIPEFRDIFRLLKYPKINVKKTTPITDKQPLNLKNIFWTKNTTSEHRASFRLLKNVSIEFLAPTVNIKMYPCMAMVNGHKK